MSYWKGRKRGPQSPEHKAKTVINLSGVNGKPPWNKGKKLPQFSGENHFAWKGDEADYFTIHSWLKRHFGVANKCENLECKKTSNRFHWALIKGKTYIHKRENFWMLCASCHAIYDGFRPPKDMAKGNTFRRIDLVGRRFGRVVVTKLVGKNKWGNLVYEYICDCGNTKQTPSGSLRDGRVRSCSCLQKETKIGNKYRL